MHPLAKKCAAAALLAVVAAVGIAQAPAITRTVVARADASVPGREAIAARVEVAAGGQSGWHTHPGDEISVVNDGEVVLMVAGQPPRKVVAGEGFIIPAGTPHNAKNESAAPVKLVGVYIVEKGKPLASPASAPGQ
jgi:quercetin dioxygenase-like cupin family protein